MSGIYTFFYHVCARLYWQILQRKDVWKAPEGNWQHNDQTKNRAQLIQLKAKNICQQDCTMKLSFTYQLVCKTKAESSYLIYENTIHAIQYFNPHKAAFIKNEGPYLVTVENSTFPWSIVSVYSLPKRGHSDPPRVLKHVTQEKRTPLCLNAANPSRKFARVSCK